MSRNSRLMWHDKSRKVELTVWISLLLGTVALALFVSPLRVCSPIPRLHHGCIVMRPPLMTFLNQTVRSKDGEMKDLWIQEHEDQVDVSLLLDGHTTAPRFFAGQMTRAEYRKLWQAAVDMDTFDMAGDPYPRTNTTECILSIRQCKPWRSTTVVIGASRMTEAPYSKLIGLMDEAVSRTPLKQAKRVTITGDTVSIEM